LGDFVQSVRKVLSCISDFCGPFVLVIENKLVLHTLRIWSMNDLRPAPRFREIPFSQGLPSITALWQQCNPGYGRNVTKRPSKLGNWHGELASGVVDMQGSTPEGDWRHDACKFSKTR
jgi:hypothetical protein